VLNELQGGKCFCVIKTMIFYTGVYTGFRKTMKILLEIVFGGCGPHQPPPPLLRRYVHVFIYCFFGISVDSKSTITGSLHPTP